MSVMPQEDVRKAVLSVFYRAAYGGLTDLVGANNRLHTTDGVTGLPVDAGNAVSTAKREGGVDFALGLIFNNRTIARGMLVRNAYGSDKPTPISLVPEKDWTASERDAVKQLERQVGAVFVEFKHSGFVRDTNAGWDGETLEAHSPDGMPSYLVHVTPKGLEEARKRIRGTKWERGPTRTWDTLPAELRAQSKAAHWAGQG